MYSRYDNRTSFILCIKYQIKSETQPPSYFRNYIPYRTFDHIQCILFEITGENFQNNRLFCSSNILF